MVRYENFASCLVILLALKSIACGVETTISPKASSNEMSKDEEVVCEPLIKDYQLLERGGYVGLGPDNFENLSKALIEDGLYDAKPQLLSMLALDDQPLECEPVELCQPSEMTVSDVTIERYRPLGYGLLNNDNLSKWDEACRDYYNYDGHEVSDESNLCLTREDKPMFYLVEATYRIRKVLHCIAK